MTDLLSSSMMSGLAVVMATSVGTVAGGDSQILWGLVGQPIYKGDRCGRIGERRFFTISLGHSSPLGLP